VVRALVVPLPSLALMDRVWLSWIKARLRRATQTKRDDRETNRHEPTRWRLTLIKPSRLAISRPALRQLHRLRGSYHSRMTPTRVQAIAAAALVLVAVVGLIPTV
jgi:hypothetical protein